MDELMNEFYALNVKFSKIYHKRLHILPTKYILYTMYIRTNFT